MENVGVAHDVVGPDGRDDRQVEVLGDDRLEQGLPDLLRRRRVLVGEVHELHTVIAMETREFLGEQPGIAMPPAGPEPALPTIRAAVRTPSGELHDHAAQSAVVRISPVIDQLPADAIIVEPRDHSRRRGRERGAVFQERQPRNPVERRALFDSRDQFRHRRLAFTAHDDVDRRRFFEDGLPVIGRKYAAIDDARVRQGAADLDRQGDDDRMSRRRAVVTEKHDFGGMSSRPRHDVGDG